MIDPYDADVGGGPEGAPLRQVLSSLHYIYPALVFVYYMATSTVAVCTLQTRSSEQAHPRRRPITWLFALIIITYLAQLLALGIQSAVRHVFPFAEQDVVIGLMSCVLSFGVVFARLLDEDKPVWYPYIGTFGIALGLEPALGALSWAVRPTVPFKFTDYFDIAAFAIRYLSIILTLFLYFFGSHSSQPEKGTDSERQSLLKANGHASHDSDSEERNDSTQENSSYGTSSESSTDSNQSSDTEDDENPYAKRQRQASEQMEKRLKEKGNWVTYAKSFKVRLSVHSLSAQAPLLM